MPYQPASIPPIPEETANIAGALFGQGHLYIRLGNQLGQLLLEVSKTGFDLPANQSQEVGTLVALMTAIQYAEGLSDRQSAEALARRVDLKYALHLPLNYPSFDPEYLCQFRRRLYHDPAGQQGFQELLGSLAALGLLEGDEGQRLSAAEVLAAVCAVNRMEIVQEAIFRALEALAVNHPEWLRKITLPHWYKRYGRTARLNIHLTPNGCWKTIAAHTGEDMQYLLAEIDRSERLALSALPEVQKLRQVWEEQYEQILDSESGRQAVQFRAAGCAFCAAHPGEIKPSLF